MDNSLENNLFVEINNFGSLRSGDLDMGINQFDQRCQSPSLENLFSNKDVLARRLKNRPDRDSLVDRHIIPAHSAAPGIHDKVTQLERKKTGDILQKKIRARPSRQQLIQRHILTEARVDPSLIENMGKLERQRITDSLNERLQARPGPIELIQEGIIPVDSPIKNVLDQKSSFDNALSPSSSATGSPNVADLESGLNTLNCTSPSPPVPDSMPESYKNQFQGAANDNINPNCLVRTVSGESHSSNRGQSPISLSQKENEKLVRTMAKKAKASKTKVKKLKFHECRPPEMISQDSTNSSEVDERYKKLLEQQTLYLRLQVLQQNAMMNALQGNTDSIEAFNDEIEEAIKKEKCPAAEPQTVTSIEGKKLDDLRVIDLRAQLKQRGLLVSGTKAKLIERLSAYAEGRATAADFSYSANNALSEDLPQISTVPAITNVDVTPSTTVMQVTTYATSSGQTYQVIQAVPQQSRNVYQVLPAQCDPAPQQIPQIQLNHINIHPVVEVTEPHVMMIEDAVQNSKRKASQMQPPTSSNMAFQMSSHSNPSPPTILIHSVPQLQKASLLHHEKPRMQVQQYPSYRHSPYQTCQTSKTDSTSLSTSTSTSQYNRNKYIISPTKSDICQQLSAFKSTENYDNRKLLNSVHQNNAFRSRSSSEPQYSLCRNKDLNIDHSNMKHEMTDNSFKNMTNQSTLSPPGFKQTQQKACEPMRRETVDDIMEIIGELSTPSPSNAGSPLMSTSSSPNAYMGLSSKLEYPPPYNSCAYGNPKLRANTDNKSLNVSPQNKLFSSVPENINTLGCNQFNSNFLSSPYGSLSPNSFSGSLNSNLSGSLTNLQGHQPSPAYNHSLSAGSVRNHFSSTGSIPQQIQSDNYHRLSGSPITGTSPYGTSPNTSSNYLKIDYRAVSPIGLPDDSMAMELDHISSTNTQNNTLSWLDLNMETNSTNNMQYQNVLPKEIPRNNTYYSTHNSNSNMADVNPSMVYSNVIYGNNPRTQNTLYGGNPRLQDGCLSLFDLDSGDY